MAIAAITHDPTVNAVNPPGSIFRQCRQGRFSGEQIVWVMEFALKNLSNDLKVFLPGKGCLAQANNDSLTRLPFIISERLNELPAQSGWCWFLAEKHAASTLEERENLSSTKVVVATEMGTTFHDSESRNIQPLIFNELRKTEPAKWRKMDNSGQIMTKLG